MRFLLDESADVRLLAYLVSLGHDVTAIARDHPASLADRKVLAIAQREGRVLITRDRDVGELIVSQQLPHNGVIFFRLRIVSVANQIGRMAFVLSRHQDELLRGGVLVVTDSRVRPYRPKRP